MTNEQKKKVIRLVTDTMNNADEMQEENIIRIVAKMFMHDGGRCKDCPVKQKCEANAGKVFYCDDAIEEWVRND